jgi:hypothetical protein
LLTPIISTQAIQERIKEMDFQDSKVRISNVDSQGSEQNIVIQVIGEIANKGEESKKFVQTFVLAQQPSGYFVLNDILRYIDEDQEEVAEPAAEAAEEPTAPAEVPAADEAEAEPEVAADEKAAPEQEPAQLDTTVVTQKLEEAAVEAPVAAEEPAVEPAVEAPEPAHTEQAQTQPDVEKTVEEIAEEEVKKPEEPKDPSPTPAVAPATRVAAPAPAQPEKPKEPPKPMSWASRVAAAAGTARPVAPIPKAATPPAAAQPRAPVPAPAQQPAPAAQQAQPAESSAVAPTPKDQGNEWQTAETKRQSRTQPASVAPAEKEGTMAYIKYVTAKVRDEDLKAALSAFGELAYFDINRTKVWTFTEEGDVSPYPLTFFIELRLCGVQDSGWVQCCGRRQSPHCERREHCGRATPPEGQRVRWHQLQRFARRCRRPWQSWRLRA